jgi:hypothetical protein
MKTKAQQHLSRSQVLRPKQATETGTNDAAGNTQPTQRATVSGRIAYRSSENPATPPSTLPNIARRRGWSPLRKGVAKTQLELNKMKNVMQNYLGHGARINENLTMNVPVRVLPDDLKKGGSQ